MVKYIQHPLIKPDSVEQRLYQLDLAGKALSSSTLVVLPTGLGKTIVALLVMASRLEATGKKVVMLSPTKPLVEQHAAFFSQMLNLEPEEVMTFTGNLPPAKRENMWEKGRVIVSTPQVIENDLLTKRISLRDVAHVTFDEAHRAVGNYSYTYIAEEYFNQAKEPLCLAITASPGSSDEKIAEVCESLHIEKVAVKTEDDSDVAPYIHHKQVEWVHLKLPDEMQRLKDLLDKVLEDRIQKLDELGYRLPYGKKTSKKELLGLQRKMQGQLRSGNPDPSVYSSISLMAEILKAGHAIEVIETQGVGALAKYVDRLKREACTKGASKASKRLMEDLFMRQLSHRLKECGAEHPKLETVCNIVKEELTSNPDSRVIVFTNFRDTAEMVTNALSEIEDINPVKFVGQSSKYKDKGLTQKQQVEIIDHFKQGEFNVLVATSVAEEGLDIPATDLVVFYEPIPSEIRSIQRKGRTGRKHAGRVVVLVTKGTRDEGYYWSSANREKKMQGNIRQLQETLSTNEQENPFVKEKQRSLEDFDNNVEPVDENGPQVVADQREIRSTVTRNLQKAGASLSVKTLEVGDYVVSENVAIERKETGDFVNSLIEGKLFEQISNLTRTYEKTILIIEGEGLFNARRINPSSIYGAMLSISMDFETTILHTRDAEETAALILQIAKRHQRKDKKPINPHGKKAAPILSKQQEYIVSAIPQLGPQAARNLLEHFGSVEAVMKACEEELREVKLIGPKTAARIREVVCSEYKG
ncbi:DEAD/DEAH box helicase [Methanohalophilus sp. RSK]|uniref:DEAD/DEAH box helicase n=1 Tax=Methanohalophilus sp. RSK TaxID=2485783 RepID=UPI000F43D997|nr:DEAD/DEAH box helicase [Methanohalophilus sp. RSK]RNI14999.1 DEAD/DEAH box helicase [Methanohalophilus sp. RSK]